MVNLQRELCALFEVIPDDHGVQRIVTPLLYTDSRDQVVVRVRPLDNGFQIDENGEAAFNAAMAGGDADADIVQRWAEQLPDPVYLDDDDTLLAVVDTPVKIAPAIFRVAEAAQQLYALAINRPQRNHGEFKRTVTSLLDEIARSRQIDVEADVVLPYARGLAVDRMMMAPHAPLAVVVATSQARLLEAQMIHLLSRAQPNRPFVLAVAESQQIVGKKHFERANYYTGKTVTFDRNDLAEFVREQIH